MKRTITRKDRSPMNKKRWCLELECGHEVWVTGKPRGKQAECEECSAPDAPICAQSIQETKTL